MQKLIRAVQTYLLLAAPFVVVIMIWRTLQPESVITKSDSFFVRALWEVLAWHLMTWFAVFILFLVSLVVIPEARENTLVRLANIKERDEREEFVTGRAAKSAYISGLSVLLLLLFFSMFQLQITRLPADQAIKGKTGTLNLGMHFNLIDDSKVENAPSGKVLFETKDIPLSKSGILLTLIAWLILAFHIRARKEA